MKNLLVSLVIALSMLSFGKVYAQDEASTDVAERTNVEASVSDDDEVAEAQEQVEDAIENIREVLGDEIGDEVAKELRALSAEEKRELVNGLKDGFKFEMDGMGTSFGEALVAMTAIVLSLGMPIIILLLILVFSHRKRRQKMELIRSYIDSGKDVPENILAELGSSASSDNQLRSGMTYVAVGLGIIIAFGIASGGAMPGAFGLIPLFVGIAKLVFWKIENKSEV